VSSAVSGRFAHHGAGSLQRVRQFPSRAKVTACHSDSAANIVLIRTAASKFRLGMLYFAKRGSSVAMH
jgi:hypothetical protein